MPEIIANFNIWKRLLHFNKYSWGALGRFNPTVLLQAIKSPHQFNPAKYISPTVSPAGMNKKKKNRSQTVWPLGGTGSYLVSADGRPYERPLSLLCCSAVLLGAGELRLEPVLGGEEAVASQHRDQPHDLWPFPHAYKAEHRWTQGKDTQMQTRSFSAVSLMDAGAVAACISKILHYPALVLIAIVLAVVLVLL